MSTSGVVYVMGCAYKSSVRGQLRCRHRGVILYDEEGCTHVEAHTPERGDVGVQLSERNSFHQTIHQMIKKSDSAIISIIPK